MQEQQSNLQKLDLVQLLGERVMFGYFVVVTEHGLRTVFSFEP